MIKRILLIIGIVVVLAAGAFLVWAETPLQAMPLALDALKSTSLVQVSTLPDQIEFLPVETTHPTGIIFYPGGRVDYRAYSPLAARLAEAGYPTFLVKMPLSLAVFGINRADAVIAKHPEIVHWVIGGHSLGGAMAAQYAFDHPSTLAGIFFLAAYPTEASDLSQSGLASVSITGDKDGLATNEDLKTYTAYFPTSTEWIVISGGNHAQMGWYGLQPGDGTASISRDDQQNQVINAIQKLLVAIEGQATNE